jgi:hypothetical protein
MTCRNLGPATVICAAAILLAATAQASAAEPVEEIGSPFDSRIGWFYGCLAIKSHTLEPGTPLTIVMFNEDEHLIEQRILGLRATGKILGKTHSREKCPALSEWKGGGNEREDVSFYTVALDDGPFTNPEDGIFGFGILGLDADTKPIDLDGNGVADSFSVCDSLVRTPLPRVERRTAPGRADLARVLLSRL